MKSVLSCPSKIDKTKVLKPCDSIIQVKSTAECSIGAFCNTLDLHEVKTFFLSSLSGRLRQVLLYSYIAIVY